MMKELLFLFGGMEFLRGRDTLTITNRKEIHSVIIDKDTFLVVKLGSTFFQSGSGNSYLSQEEMF